MELPISDSRDGTVLVRCTRCKSKFRDKAGRLRDGYSRQCPTCECMVFFLDGSSNKDIHDALREAERVRKLLRQEEEEDHKVVRSAASAAEMDGAEPAPALSRRVDRRARPAGRAVIRSR